MTTYLFTHDMMCVGCNQITNVGLRSLSLRLMDLVSLDMSYCLTLDDIALTVIASGCWKLEHINLRGK